MTSRRIEQAPCKHRPRAQPFLANLPAQVGFSAAFLLLAGAAFAGAADSYDVDATLDVHGHARFHGSTDALGHLVGIQHESQDVPGNVSWVVKADKARLRVWNFPYTVTGTRTESNAISYRQPLAGEVISDAEFTGAITLNGPSPGASYRFLPLERRTTFELTLSSVHDFTVAPAQTFEEGPSEHHFGTSSEGFARPLYIEGRAGRATASTVDGIRASGAMFVLLYGGNFSLTDANGQQNILQSGERLNQSRTVVDPSGTAGHWQYDRTVLILEGPTVSARISAPEPAQLILALASVTGAWTGDFEMADVAGSIEVDGEPLAPEPSLFQTIGNFTAEASYEGDTAHWKVVGPATFVGVNGLDAYGSRPAAGLEFLVPAAAAVTALALLLAFLRGFATIVGFLFSRLRPEKILAVPTRLAILEAVRARPGVSLRELAALVREPYGTIRYHARVLAGANQLKQVPRGKAVHLFPSDHSALHARRALTLESDPPVRYLLDRLQAGERSRPELVADIRSAFGMGRVGAWRVLRRASQLGLIELVHGDAATLVRAKSTSTASGNP